MSTFFSVGKSKFKDEGKLMLPHTIEAQNKGEVKKIEQVKTMCQDFLLRSVII